MSFCLHFSLLKDDKNNFNKALIFDIDTYKYIRTHYNIVGKFIGILPEFKQQYNISNFPCEVNILEIVWVLQQLESKTVEYRLHFNDNHSIQSETFNDSGKDGQSLIPFRQNYLNIEDNTVLLWNHLKEHFKNDLNYAFYEYLKTKFKTEKPNNEYQYPCLLSGLKFGGLYNLYLNDPLTIHSKYIVKNFVLGGNEGIPLVQLQSDIRLGSTTKKEVLTTFYNQETETFESYSFEWAGF